MGKCFNKCDDHFKCLCHKKCHCKEKHCNRKKKFEKECICIEWSVPHGQTQTVFQSGGFDQIFTAGFISYDCGNAPFITVRFFNGALQVGNPINVFQDSSTSFIHTGFDRITVTCANPAPGLAFSGDDDCPNECEGEICIRTRFPIDEEISNHVV